MSVFHNAVNLFACRQVHHVDAEPYNLAFHDLTTPDTPVPFTLKRLLGLGLKFCPTPNKLTVDHLLETFPYFERSLRLKWKFKYTGNRMPLRTTPPGSEPPKKIFCPNRSYMPPPGHPKLIEEPLQLMKNSIATATWTPKRHQNLNRPNKLLLRTLRHHPHLHVLSTDKNLGPAIMTRTQYISWVLKHLQDQSTYRRILTPKEPNILRLKSILRKFYRDLKIFYNTALDVDDTKIITFELANKTINRFYALAKIHKPNLPLRPIVSNSGSIFEGLSKWLDYKLRPYLLKTKSYLKSSDSLINDLKHLEADADDQLITFDISSLYTSLVIRDALFIIEEITRNDPWAVGIMKGLQLLLHHNYFEFGDTLWHQIHGTAMGTPVAPTFASLVLAHIEDTCLLPIFGTMFKYYRRYIDDGFIILKHGLTTNRFQLNRFLAMFKLKSKLQFTFDTGDEVTFLDLCIYRHEDRFTHRTHQKKLNLYLYIPSTSAHPPGVLKGLIFGLLKKYKIQNPMPQDFKKFFQLLFTRLEQRGYRSSLLKPLFSAALKATCHTPAVSSREKLVFKVPYDPNGPSRHALRHILRFKDFDRALQILHIENISICYLKPPTLKNMLSPTTLNLEISPTPADLLP